MTRKDFLNMDWNDSHVGYDMKVGRYRRIAYMTLSSKYPGYLCLVADDKNFPLLNSGCGVSKNLCSADVIQYLKKNEQVQKIVAVVDGEIHDLLPGKMCINGIDAEVLFDVTPYKSETISQESLNFEIEEKEV